MRVLEKVIERMWLLVDLELDPGNGRLLSPSHGLWNICPACNCWTNSCFQGLSLERACIVETIWTVYVTEPSYTVLASVWTFKILESGCGDLLVSQCPRQVCVTSLLTKPAICPSGAICFLLRSPCGPCVGSSLWPNRVAVQGLLPLVQPMCLFWL